MTDRELMQQALDAKQTSLIELLEAVPADARLVVDDGPHSTSFYPVGRMCHGAAAALRERLAQPERQWQWLTEPEIHELDWPEDVSFEDILPFVRAIEAKIKEKNCG